MPSTPSLLDADLIASPAGSRTDGLNLIKTFTENWSN